MIAETPELRATDSGLGASLQEVGVRSERLRRMFGPLVVVVLALIAAAPLFRGGMVAGHDAHEHVTRTAEYARAVASGVWWPQWSPNLGHGYGEPIFLFNPPLFYILAAIPALAGVPVVSAVNLATALLLVLAGLGVYAWAAPVFGRPAAVVAACAYAWAPYVLLDVYVRQALTELAAVSTLPWALWGLSAACRVPSARSVAAAAVAVGLLLLSSTPAALVAAPALAGQVAILADRRRPNGTVAGLAALALSSLLASVFWVPALAERHLLHFERLVTGDVNYADFFLEPWQLVSSYWGSGMSGRDPDVRAMGFGLGHVHLVLAIGGLVLLALRRVGDLFGRQVLLALGLAGLGIAMSLQVAEPLWDRVPPLQYLQFPWRFLILPTLGCAILAALPTALIARRLPRAAALLAVGCVGLLVAQGWTRAQPRELVAYSDERFAPAAVAGRDRGRGTLREYETIWTVRSPSETRRARLRVLSGSATVADLGGTAHEQRYSVTASSPTRLRLNTFYFPGWRVLVDGREQAIDYGNPNGLIEFSVEPGERLVVARFEPSPPRWIGAALSLAGLAIVILLVAGAARAPWAAPPKASTPAPGAAHQDGV